MSDIVRRLRNPPFGTETSERQLMLEAADAIDALQAENERLRGSLDSIARNTCCDGCREAGLVAAAALAATAPGS